MRSAALALTSAALVGCGGGKRDPVADAVKAGVAEQLGVKVERVTCAKDACEARLAGGAVVRVRLAVQGREATWESEDVVLTGPLQARIREELDGLGVEAAIDCGPPRVVPAGELVRCELAGGGAAWVTLGGGVAVGELGLEVALTKEVVRARTEPVDVQGLDDLSRALDTDEAQGGAADEPEPAPGAEDQDGGVPCAPCPGR